MFSFHGKFSFLVAETFIFKKLFYSTNKLIVYCNTNQ